MQTATGNGAAAEGWEPFTIPENLADWLGVKPDTKRLTVYFPPEAPFEYAGQVYTELTVCEPTLGQVEQAAQKRGIAQDVALISLVSKTPESVVRALPHHQYRRASVFLNVFLFAAPPETPLPLPG